MDPIKVKGVQVSFADIDVTDALLGFARAAKEAADALQGLRRTMSMAFSLPAEFSAWLLTQTLGPAYLEEHDHIPGSLRTRRLRKKRVTRLLAWAERRFG